MRDGDSQKFLPEQMRDRWIIVPKSSVNRLLLVGVLLGVIFMEILSHFGGSTINEEIRKIAFYITLFAFVLSKVIFDRLEKKALEDLPVANKSSEEKEKKS